MNVNLVGSFQNIHFFKSSKWFRRNMGKSVMMNKNQKSDHFSISGNDVFQQFYYEKFGSVCQMEGSIGPGIRLWTDHNIRDNSMGIMIDNKFAEMEFETPIANELGPDEYLGRWLKDVSSRASKEELEEMAMERMKMGKPDLLTTNPGAVTYEDIMAWIDIEKKKKDI